MRVGGRLYAIGEAVEASIDAAAERDGRTYGIVDEYVGHGIGTEMHMDPQIPNYAVAESGPKLPAGWCDRADGHARRDSDEGVCG